MTIRLPAMEPRKYMLNGREPVLVEGLAALNWSRTFHGREWIVADSEQGSTKVLTLFMGYELPGSTHERALVFETMVFGGPCDDACERYATWEEAESGHARWVERAFGIEPERALEV